MYPSSEPRWIFSCSPLIASLVPSVVMASRELIAQYDPAQAMIPHSGDVSERGLLSKLREVELHHWVHSISSESFERHRIGRCHRKELFLFNWLMLSVNVAVLGACFWLISRQYLSVVMVIVDDSACHSLNNDYDLILMQIWF